MSDELRNTIARGHCVEDGDNVCRTLCKVCCDYATARLALIRLAVLEEAAKVAEVGYFNGEICAAAIRALKEENEQ